MTEQTPDPRENINWRIQLNQRGSVQLNCSACEQPYEYQAELFEDAAQVDGQISELSKTGLFIIPQGDSNMLAWVLALLAYYFSHRWVNGPDVFLNQGILIPVFIAVLTHTLTKATVAGLWNAFGQRVPVYEFTCSNCQAETMIAASPKYLGLVVAAPEQNALQTDSEAAQ